MSVFIGKFSSSFEDDNLGIDQVEEQCCLGGEIGSSWYNGISEGDYIFPIKNGSINYLWKMKGYGKKTVNGQEETAALFDIIKKFDNPISLDVFIKYKYFNLDINLLNKTKKQTQGYGFHRIDYVKSSQEIENVNFEEEQRKIYISLQNRALILSDGDIVIKIDSLDLTNIKGFYISRDNKLFEYEPLIELYNEKNPTKYSLNQLLEFSLEHNDNAINKKKFLTRVINGVKEQGYFEVKNPVSLYDCIIIGRKVTKVSNKQDIDEENVEMDESIDKSILGSWIDIDDSKVNFLGRKRTDYSTFFNGITIPQRYHQAFSDNLSEEMVRGKSIKVSLIIEGKVYKGNIRWPGSKNRKGVTIQLIYTEKALLEFLKSKLKVSYDYIMKYLNENDKKPSSVPDIYNEYIDFYKGNELDTFVLKLISRDDIKANIDIESNFNVLETVTYINNYIKANGFSYDIDLINNFYTSLKTKPFVILSGISGTGKSKLIELFANALGATASNGRFKLIPVKPDWSDATELLGYRDIEGNFNAGIIIDIASKAIANPDVPYFVCLDEMNLARVEYYFSDILSLMETRRVNEHGDIITNTLLSKEQMGRDEEAISKYGDVYIPQNLYIIGTVNMDETTFPFSKKVLDRANTIEFNEVNLDYSFDDLFESDNNIEPKVYHNDLLKSEFIKISECKEHKDIAKKVIAELIKINNILEGYNQHFGYRVRDEIVFYMIYATREELMSFEVAFDYCVVQKILPKISGSSEETLEILKELFTSFNNYNFEAIGYLEDKDIKAMEKTIKDNGDAEIIKYKLTNKKLIYMMRRFIRDGFTTFWQ